jgi:glucosamine--fructose-6-phosphate aminotransferase (isomerizing)
VTDDTPAPGALAGTVLLARGSSDNVAVYGRYLIEMAARRPAGLAAPSVHTRYQADVDYSGYLPPPRRSPPRCWR